MTAINAASFDPITRSLRRARACGAKTPAQQARQSHQDIALATLGFPTFMELQEAIEVAEDCGTTAFRAEEFRQKRAHMARAAACCEAVFSLPDLEPLLGPLDKAARDAVIQSLSVMNPWL